MVVSTPFQLRIFRDNFLLESPPSRPAPVW